MMSNMKRLVPLAALLFGMSGLVPVAHTQESSDEKKEPKPTYVVVLKNGQRIPARTKPVSAFGKLRYMEPGGTNRVLATSAVDLEKTRAANAQAPTAKAAGTLSVGSGLAKTKPKESGGTDAETAEVKKNRNQNVMVFSATWCTYCKQLKKFLAENGISASITEVDRLPQAEQDRAEAEMRRLTGKVAYPTVVIGDSAIAGYSPQRILKALGR